MRFWIAFSSNSILPGSNTPPNKKAPGADRINTQQDEEENNQNNKNTGNNKKDKDKKKEKKRKNGKKGK